MQDLVVNGTSFGMISRVALTSETNAVIIAKAAIKTKLGRIMRAGVMSNCFSEVLPQTIEGCGDQVFISKPACKVSCLIYNTRPTFYHNMAFDLDKNRATLVRGISQTSQRPIVSPLHVTQRVRSSVMLMRKSSKEPLNPA
jgi:hypothetical protein